jgi:transcriptional regulator NrdR family protein
MLVRCASRFNINTSWTAQTVERSFMPGIPCPLCESTLSDVMESRPTNGAIRRRRKCFNGHTYTTREEVAEDSENRVAVGKREGPTLREQIRALLLDGKSVSEVLQVLDVTRNYARIIERELKG